MYDILVFAIHLAHQSSSVYRTDRRALRSMRVHGDKTAAVIFWSAMEHTSGLLDLTANAHRMCAVTPVIGNTVDADEQKTLQTVQSQIDRDLDFSNAESVKWTYEQRIQAYTDTIARGGKLIRKTSIYEWVNNQQREFRAGKMNSSREKLCRDAFIPLDQTRISKRSFDDWVELLKQSITKQQQIDTKSSLDHWIRNQRHLAKKGKLSSAQIEKLVQLKIIIVQSEQPPQKPKISFQERIQEFITVTENGETVETNTELYRWIQRQQTSFKNNNLTAERLKLCNDANLRLTTKPIAKQKTLDEKIELVKHALDSKIHILKSSVITYRGNEEPVGQISHQLRHYRKTGILSKEKIHFLETAGFIFEPHNHNWDKHFKCWAVFVEDGDQIKRDTEISGLNIGIWFSHQKRLYQTHTLPDVRMQKMCEVDSTWFK
jgi:hypothetical protein